MNSIIQEKAQNIYSQFSKAPIIEMVQYMVDESVDAQILHQLKLIDRKCHKNPHVKSYAERIYASYERVCKVLVTYPKLTFSNCKFMPEKDRFSEFMNQYSTHPELNEPTMNTLLDIVNQALLYGIESTNDHLVKAAVYLSHKGERDKLCQLLKDACGEDYSNYIKSTLNT